MEAGDTAQLDEDGCIVEDNVSMPISSKLDEFDSSAPTMSDNSEMDQKSDAVGASFPVQLQRLVQVN